VSQEAIEIATGRVPREARYLATRANSVAEFEPDRVDLFKTKASQLVKSADADQKAEYLNLVEQLLLHPVAATKGVSSSFYDRGLLYCDANKKWQFLSRPAKDALTRVWAENTQSVPIVEPGLSQSEIGGRFEAALWTAFVRRARMSLECRSADAIARGSPPLPPREFDFAVQEVVRFDLATMAKNTSGRAVLYKPESQVFGCWDFIVHDPSNDPNKEDFVGFFSLGIQVPSVHEKPESRFEKAFAHEYRQHYNVKDSGSQRSQVEQILDAIAGRPNAHKNNEAIMDLQWKAQAAAARKGKNAAALKKRANAAAAAVLPTKFDITKDGKILRNVHFFYASGAVEADLAKDSIPFPDVMVFGRQSLGKLGIVWEK